MSKRLLTLFFAVFIAVLMVPALPVRAQGIEDIPVPPACTPEEQQQLSENALEILGRFAEAASSVVPETAEDYAALALTMNEVRQYFDGDELDLPFCTDGIMFGSTVEFYLDNYILEMQQSALYFYTTKAGDTEFADQLMEYGTLHIEKVTYYQEQFSQIADVLGGDTPLLSEWLPTCTEEDNARDVNAQLLDLEAALNEEALDTFVSDSASNTDLLYIMEDTILAWETLTSDMPACSEIFWRELLSGVLYYETSMALHWAAMAEYAEGDLNAELVVVRDEAAENIASDLEEWHALFDEAGAD